MYFVIPVFHGIIFLMKDTIKTKIHKYFNFFSGAGIICLVLTLFISCNGFFTDNNLDEKIKAAIEYANAKSYDIRIECDEVYGKIISATNVTKKEGDKFDIEFKIAEGVLFSTLKAYSRTNDNQLVELDSANIIFSECPSYASDIYKITVTFVKAADNIIIKPVCSVIPKIVDVFPPYLPSGYEQDSTIKITFNKSVDPESFGNFSCIFIELAEGGDLSDYYETPYFTNDNTVLNIPAVFGKNIISYTSSNNTADIKVILDFTSACDVDGIHFDKSITHNFRINKNRDTIKPLINEIHLYSTNDTTDYFYREISEEPVENWSKDTVYKEGDVVLYKYGTYSQNHVSKLYLTLACSDNQSGIDNVRIYETFLKDVEGKSNEKESTYRDYEVIEQGIDKTTGQKFYSLAADYYFTEEADGLIRLDIYAIDNVSNSSVPKTFYVIKDTVPSGLNKSFIRPNGPFSSTLNNNGQYEYTIEFQNTNFGFSLNLGAFYRVVNDISSTCVFSMDIVNNGNTKRIVNKIYVSSNIGARELVNQALAENPVNPEYDTYLNVVLEDEACLVSESSILFPHSAIISDYKEYYNNKDTPQFLAFQSLDAEEDQGYKIYSRYKANEEAEFSAYTDLGCALSSVVSFSKFEDDGMYYLYLVPFNTEYSYVTSCFGNPYIYYKNVEHQSGQSGEVPLPAITFPQEDSQIDYPQNTKMANVPFTLTYDQDKDYSNYTYAISIIENKTAVIASTTLISYLSSLSYLESNKTVSIKNGKTYDVKLIAFDSTGNKVVEQSCDTQLTLNTTDNFPPAVYLEYNIIKAYLTPNRIRVNAGRSDIDSEPISIYDTKPSDQEHHQITTAYYYIVPEVAGVKNDKLSLEQVQRDYGPARQTTINNTDKYFDISFDTLPDGQYWVYVYAEDDSSLKNYSFGVLGHRNTNYTTNYEFIYKLSNRAPSVESYNNTYIIFDPSNGNNVTIEYLDGKNWKDTSVVAYDFSGTSKYSFAYNNTLTSEQKFLKISMSNINTTTNKLSYYLHPIYINIDYYKYLLNWESNNPDEPAPEYCESKGVVALDNGYQIFCDKECFIHTLYSQTNLSDASKTKEENARNWETRGKETGICHPTPTENISFTYSDANYESIPAGYYYTTIVHFADGYISMGEVKQK